jgi:predicted RNA-binding protein with PUA-like domain
VACFLVKTEPSTYSYAQLAKDKRAVWDGVSNPVALKHMRTIQKGDTVLVYHTGDEKSVVGVAVATSDPYPDPKLADPKRTVIDLAPDRALAKPVPLGTFRTDSVLQSSELVRLPRLSVMPLSAAQLKRVLQLGGA